jgi:hypothetical protein
MFLAITLLIIVIALLLAILALLFKLRTDIQGAWPGTGHPVGGDGSPPPAIPDQITGTALAGYLLPRLAGTPADGSTPVPITQNTIVWVNRGDEVLVHLDSVSTQIAGQAVLVSVDLECDQTGRTPLVVALSLGQDAQGGLVATTDQFPRGNGALAARWGSTVQEAVWSAMLSLVNDHAAERDMSPLAFAIQNGQLYLKAGPALKIA